MIKIKLNIVVTIVAIISTICQPIAAQETAKELNVEVSEVSIVGSRAPLPTEKAVRLVQVLSRTDIETSSAKSVNDLLKLVAGADVRQRGAFGIQTDIGINGGNSDQLTVLLNGVNISNPHTGHLTVDLPISPDDIERIEVIEGGASRIYGSNAFSGAINIVTRNAEKNSVGATLQAGSYGTVSGNARYSQATNTFKSMGAIGYTQSDGGTINSDFKKGNAYWNGHLSTKKALYKTQLGFSTMEYGANTFYGTGSNNQFEENSRYLVSLSAETQGHISVKPQLYWNRSYDHYVWTRNNPSAYENFHQTNVYGANIGAHTQWFLGSSALGFEVRHEEILSTRLGNELADGGEQHKVPNTNAHYKYFDGRTNYNLYAEHNIIAGNVTLSLGVIANKNSAIKGGIKLYPGVDVAWRPTCALKIFTSFNQSLRTPTFTDLYYNGPGLQGNSALQPEKSTDFTLGASHTCQLVSSHIKLFYRHGTDMIDWVKKPNATIWTTANSNIDTKGFEALAVFRFAHILGNNGWLQNITLSYCYINQERVDKEQQAQYATELSFLRHKFVGSVNHRIYKKLSASWDFIVRDRNGQFDNIETGKTEHFGTISQIDLKLKWVEERYSIFAQANNLTNKHYYDISNVQQPGLWVMAGVKIDL